MNNTNDTNKDKLIYPELSYKIIGALINVHNQLGPNFQEIHYHKSIGLEFNKQKIKFENEKEIDLCYNENKDFTANDTGLKKD